MTHLVHGEEFSPISVGSHGALTPEMLLSLEKAWRLRTGKDPSKFFNYGPTSVTPKNWVGTLQTRYVRLEIVPRGALELADDDKNRLDRNLTQMLRLALGTGAVRLGEAAITHQGSLYDQSVDALCDRVLLARRRRVLREYGARTEPSKSVRGRIVFPQQSLTSVRSPGTFVSHWVELHQDVPANRFLKGALRRLRARVGLRVQRRVDECIVQFDGVETPSDPLDELHRIRLDRIPSDYGEAISLAHDLLQGHAAGLFAGSFSAESQVIYTPDLFETFLYRLVHDVARSQNVQVLFHPKGRPLGSWDSGPFEGAEFGRMIPDIELRRLGEETPLLLIDAKWKWPKESSKGLGLDRSDVHQVMAYAARTGCTRVALVYPRMHEPPASSGHAIRISTSQPITLTPIFLPLLWDRLEDAMSRLKPLVQTSVAESASSKASHEVANR